MIPGGGPILYGRYRAGYRNGPFAPWAIRSWPPASPCPPPAEPAAGRSSLSPRRIAERHIQLVLQAGQAASACRTSSGSARNRAPRPRGIPEQVEALVDHREDQGVGIDQAAVQDPGGVEATEPRGIDLRVALKGGAVGAAGEAPDPPPQDSSNRAAPARGPSFRK